MPIITRENSMTIKQCLQRAVEKDPNAIALKYKREGEWQTTTYRGLLERSWHVSEMLVKLGIKSGDRVAIYRENSPEWFEIYHGIVGIGAIAVPVDAKLREQEVRHIFHDCGVSVVFCSARLAEVLAGLNGQVPDIRTMVVLDCNPKTLVTCEKIAHTTYELLWEEVSAVAMSAERAYDRLAPEEDSPASFIYTSGTTGRQKGAILSHRNFMANVEGIQKAIYFTSADNFLLILPLHHSFAFTTSVLLPVSECCQVTLVESLKTIKSNMVETSPTALLAVPLLLEKMLARIMNGINESRPAKLMFRFGLGKVIGKKVKEGLGGKVRLIVSGGAPISPNTLNGWMKLGFNIVEGYGITETAPVLSVNPVGLPRVGTVGLPLENVEIKIHKPNSEGVGEIIARGENVMQGYYNNPEETGKVLIDGWYHTGDLGRFDEKGYLVISGRKKSLIVNREGKNIYPEEVERQVLESRYVLECLAIGYREPNETGERVGLIVVPDQDVFDAKEVREGKRLSEKQVEQLVRDDLRQQLAELSDYKRPRKIEIRFDEFEKTTTQKIKRYLYAINTNVS
ncbi:MAG: AMP-binding protein [Kiritimatiellaceae bacterium]|nr:AMP-binding protein [Kiritimatiellaceae bacterium]